MKKLNKKELSEIHGGLNTSIFFPTQNLFTIPVSKYNHAFAKWFTHIFRK